MALRSLPSRIKPAQQSRVTQQPKRAEAFYVSPEWRALKADVIAERGRRCEGCGKTTEDDGSPVSLILDHVIERRDGGANLDKTNLKLLCVRAGGNGQPHSDGKLGGCHARKTEQASQARSRMR